MRRYKSSGSSLVDRSEKSRRHDRVVIFSVTSHPGGCLLCARNCSHRALNTVRHNVGTNKARFLYQRPSHTMLLNLTFGTTVTSREKNVKNNLKKRKQNKKENTEKIKKKLFPEIKFDILQYIYNYNIIK